MNLKLGQKKNRIKKPKLKGRIRLPSFAYLLYLLALTFALTGVTYSRYYTVYSTAPSEVYVSRFYGEDYAGNPAFYLRPTAMTLNPLYRSRTCEFLVESKSIYNGTTVRFSFMLQFSAALPEGTRVFMAHLSKNASDTSDAFAWIELTTEDHITYTSPAIGTISRDDAANNKTQWVSLKIDCTDVTVFPTQTYTVSDAWIYCENVD